MKTKNHNIRFNMEKEDERRAWELLHSPKVREVSKSQNRFVIEAVNDYYDRCVERKDDPYLETREKEDAFAERIVEAVERKVISNLPALFGMYMAQMQAFSLSVPVGAYAAQGGMVYGQASADGTNHGNAAMGGGVPLPASSLADAGTAAVQGQAAAEPPDNDLIDFDAF